MRILERLGEIHRQGLLHGDFAERNILEKDGDVRLIDFDNAIPGHRCRCDMNFHPGEEAPPREIFGCDKLWDVCKNVMQIWKWSVSLILFSKIKKLTCGWILRCKGMMVSRILAKKYPSASTQNTIRRTYSI